ncbi:MAG: tRNA (5-methylaminomethyl-2-thiouridine)(34)-methyltransferase MnmD [Methylotenera sp.]|jgi:tRNA 5-methylaminomethyl-2-thiouridine biosynthesis bifunctional protein|nr:tRNA (5-methylaminomethyl-2-thiouridine)(34)-methyltransferase MnmD [Methylotenera sp.]HPH08142.1 tRNA (5-methylaminomethyl-2-thiouridine)(34)-methyltransferase MnmD [Methylotenera sp.]HPM49534.1 tRNA (5-methylaminomethyl-2-thiouridine)(34)-methyltransferase MnmD [Methylotenera sp.]HQM87416.1 tRNA (5-methylaminomethyl-2-thiouridine)(34)-methyltransferase MnmD [Methylotenera sp.]
MTHYSPAKLEWRDGQPYASTFQDVYFSSDNGLLETDYVFLQGNALQSRWQTLNTPHFTIAETGFGTGLNFLSAIKLWLEVAPATAMLHYISTEKHPLSLQDLTSALALWPTLAEFSDHLLENYEKLLQGNQALDLFQNRVCLSLLVGDATTQLRQIHGAVDAWFLDGFSPAKNPDMWQTELFQQIVRLSAVGSTFATFTSAGHVRRNLAAAGFNTQKRAGFGKKREMLQGILMSKADAR